MKQTQAQKQTQAHIDAALEALLWAVEHFEAMDSANAKMHCAAVRYSPITFRLAKAYEGLSGVGLRADLLPLAVLTVVGHEGAYELDPGR